jgi:transposase
MGVRQMRDDRSGTSARPRDRQGHPDSRFVGPGVAKYVDHLPLYRQENIFARAGLALPRSTLGQWAGVCGVRLQPLVDVLRA